MTSRRGFLASLAAVVAARRTVPQELSMDLDAFRAQCIDPYLNETFTRALTHQTMLMQDVMNGVYTQEAGKDHDFFAGKGRP